MLSTEREKQQEGFLAAAERKKKHICPPQMLISRHETWFAVYPVSSYMCGKGTGVMGVELGAETLSLQTFCARSSLKLFQLS